jgi:hypothetical protein
MTILRRAAHPAAAVLTLLAAAACSVDVHRDERDRATDVAVRVPGGDLTVRSGADAADTGLPVYPGARPLREDREGEGADVNIDTAWFGVKVAAAKFQSDDPESSVLEFYRDRLRSLGEVTECRGDVDFVGASGEKKPVCRTKNSSRETQLVVGTETRRHIVAVKPRGSGSEIALVFLQTRGEG